jgi:hypothetical protein
MKPNVNQTSLESKGVQDSVKFGIKNTGLAHIFNVLRNQLYSDKIQAVVREYSCNAVDAHVEAGVGERPIEVTLPSKLKLEFKVRDFGSALNDEEIRDVYAFYGESTKRNTNEQTGMLGIGSKSAFSYGDNFVINSYIDGKKHIWNAFIDPSQVGQISKIGTESTNEENGVEIVVPVNENDTEEFQEKARNLFKYFKVTPKIKGATQFEYSQKKALFEGEGWTWYKSERESRYGYNSAKAIATMGNIGYPIEPNDLNLSDEDCDEGLNHLISENLLVKFDIGDLDIAASREKLQFTDSTRKAVIKKLRKIKKELVVKSVEKFSNCDSLWAAKVLLGDIRDYASGLYELREILEKNVTWNGKLVEGISIGGQNGVEINRLVKPSRHGAVRYRWDDRGNLQADSSVMVVENDLGHRRGIIGRCLGMAMEEHKQVNLVEFESASIKKAWLKVYDGPIILLSELEKRPLSDFYGSSSSSDGTSTFDPAHSKKINSPAFEFDFDRDNGGWSNKPSDSWKAAEVDLEGEGVYVIIDKFKLETPEDSYYGKDASRIATLKKKFEKCGIKFPKNVYAWKIAKRGLPESAKGFVNLWKHLADAIKQHIKDLKLEQQFADSVHVNKNSEEWHKFSHKTWKLLSNLADQDGLMATNVKNWEQMNQTQAIREKLTEICELSEQFRLKINSSLKPSFDLAESNKEVYKKYGMLNCLDWYALRDYRDEKKSKRKEFVNYINVVDVCDASR